MRRVAFVSAAVLAVCVAVVLLVEIVPLLDGGDNYELAVKSVLLAVLAGYMWVQWRAVARGRGRMLKVALGLNAVVLFPLGLTAVLCHCLGGEKIMPGELAWLGAAMALFSAGAAITQAVFLVRNRRLG